MAEGKLARSRHVMCDGARVEDHVAKGGECFGWPGTCSRTIGRGSGQGKGNFVIFVNNVTFISVFPII
jgi:hypothetical protein